MAKRTCLGYAGETCTRLTDGTRCAEHERRYEAARRPGRPSARQRGYDRGHDKLRAQLLPEAYGKPCPRCGELMLKGQALHLGHAPGKARAKVEGAKAERIEHARCNESAGAD